MENSFNNQLINSFNSQFESNISLFGFATNQIITLLLALILAFIYTRYGKSLSNRKEFSSNFVLLSMTTMLIITIVKSSLALSLGLVGALSIVRFRTAIKEPEELGYLFLSIALGLGLGANQILITLIGFVILLVFIVLRDKFSSINKESNMNLVISFDKSDNIDINKLIELLDKYCDQIKLKKLSDNNGITESILKVNISDYHSLIKIKDTLNTNYPKVSINFIDTSNISNF